MDGSEPLGANINMEQDSESLQDVERQDILPSFEPKEPLPSLIGKIGIAFGHVAFIVSIAVALVGGEWLWALLLVGMYVLYQSV